MEKQKTDLVQKIVGCTAKNPKVKHLGKVLNGNMILNKYMSLDVALLCLKFNNIQFKEPSGWDDKFEGRFYNADYVNITSDKRKIPFLYACCFSKNKISETGWKNYINENEAIGRHSVQFRFRLSKLRDALNKYAIKNGGTFYIGEVCYDLSTFEIKKIHQRTSTYYNEIFNNGFELSNYLSLLLIKRDLFSHEGEIRVFYVPDDHAAKVKYDPQNVSVKPQSIIIGYDKGRVDEKNKTIFEGGIMWKDILKEVFLDSRASDVEKMILTEFLGNVPHDTTSIYEDFDKHIVIE